MPDFARNSIDKLAWILFDGGRVLSTRSIGKNVWYFPGGKREAGESDWQALSREIREELSVDLMQGSTKWLGTYSAQANGHPTGVEVQMTCYTASYDGVLRPASEIEAIAWIDLNDRHRVSQVDQLILDDLVARGLLPSARGR